MLPPRRVWVIETIHYADDEEKTSGLVCVHQAASPCQHIITMDKLTNIIKTLESKDIDAKCVNENRLRECGFKSKQLVLSLCSVGTY